MMFGNYEIVRNRKKQTCDNDNSLITNGQFHNAVFTYYIHVNSKL